MTKIIDRAVAAEKPDQIRVKDTTAAGLTFKNINSLDEAEVSKINATFKKYAVPPEITCHIYASDGNSGFTFAQTLESDIPGMTFGIYENGELIGGMSVIRIKVLNIVDGEVEVSIMGFPALPDLGSDAWHSRAMAIIQYVLDNKLPTSVDGIVLNVTKWEMFEGVTDLLRALPNAGDALKDFDVSEFNLHFSESTHTLEDGRKILYIQRNA